MPDNTPGSIRTLLKSVKRKSRSFFDTAAAKTSRDRRTQQPRSTPRIFDYSRLPTELWLLILRDATLMTPDPLDGQDSLSFLEAQPLNLAVYAHSMANKLALSLVSQRFAALVRPFLLEFVWISRAAQAKALAHQLLLESFARPRAASSGHFIRRLHIETPVLERCAPADLHTILECAPQLTVYTDHQSVQRACTRGDVPADPRCRPEKLLSLLAHPRSELRRLSWTSYEDVPFHLRMSPLQHMRATRLEYLELASCSPHLRFDFSALLASPTAGADANAAMCVRLPALKSLKASLDDDMFAVLAGWDMPALRNLSVVSADFSYTGPGFTAFFTAHGSALRQLELGHSSSTIEEHYLTRPPPPLPSSSSAATTTTTMTTPPLADLVPNLRELVCSADAAWHWTRPDWIAPHVLLPAHARLELIAVRDMDARIADALADSDPNALDDAHAGTSGAFFALLEQVASLLRTDAFPALKYVRDLSVGSAALRERRPLRPVLAFWGAVLERCKERGVWLEDFRGVNITQRALLRASMRCVSGGEAW